MLATPSVAFESELKIYTTKCVKINLYMFTIISISPLNLSIYIIAQIRAMCVSATEIFNNKIRVEQPDLLVYLECQ